MKATVSDSEIHEIVQRVLRKAAGLGVDLKADERAARSPAVTEAAAPAGPAESGQASPAEPALERIVAIGADHGGFELKEILKKELAGAGYTVKDVGTHSKEPVDYPDIAHETARLVAEKKAGRGILIDGAGIGSCIAANKVPGIRAGMAYDLSSAVNAREHNDTNILTLGAGLIGVNLAKQIVKTWLETAHGGGRHAQRVQKIGAIEQQYLKQRPPW